MKEFLVRQGVLRSRIVAEGFGPTRPIAPNTNRAGRAANRRVEFRILETPPVVPPAAVPATPQGTQPAAPDQTTPAQPAPTGDQPAPPGQTAPPKAPGSGQ